MADKDNPEEFNKSSPTLKYFQKMVELRDHFLSSIQKLRSLKPKFEEENGNLVFEEECEKCVDFFRKAFSTSYSESYRLNVELSDLQNYINFSMDEDIYKTLDDINKNISSLKNTIIPKQTAKSLANVYANDAKKGENRTITMIHVFKKNRKISSQKIIDRIRKEVNPGQLGIHCLAMNPVRKGAVILMNTEEEANRIIPLIAIMGYQVDVKEKKMPMILINGTPRNMDYNVFYQLLYQQNIRDRLDYTFESFSNACKFSHYHGNFSTDKVNRIFYVNHDIRHYLIEQKNCYIDWNSYAVSDYLFVTNCYKCHMYGHPEKLCRSQVTICSHCTKEGHRDIECPDSKLPPKCVNCTYTKKKNDHRTGSSNCPVKQKAIKRELQNIDFGY